MDKLRAHKIIAARDYYYSYVIYLEELKLAGGQGYFARMADCFRVPRIRRGNYGASTVMLAQQMCGINSEITQPTNLYEAKLTHPLVISFYSSTIFNDVLQDTDKALFASLGYGAIQVVFTIPTLFLIDTKGRRTLCLIVSYRHPRSSPDIMTD